MKKILRTVLISMAVLLVAMVSLASCGKRTYSVTFKSGTETVAVAETDKEGRVYPAYAECAEGVRFVGWYESEESTTPFDFEKEITSDITLYARFASLTYEVKYDVGCEGLKAPVQESVNHDGTFTVKAAPERVGYEFKGWTDGSGLYFDGDVYVADGGTITLVATWEYRQVEVKFVGYDGEIVKKVPYGSDVLPPEDFELPHQLFCYRLSDWEGDGDMTEVTENLTFNAVYEYAPTAEENFEFTLNDDKRSYSVAIKAGYVSFPEGLAIPCEHDGLPVTKVGDCAWLEVNGDVYVPSSVRELLAGAFAGLSGAWRIIAAEGLETINNYSFAYITDTDILLPASLAEMNGKPFYDTSLSLISFAEGGANFKIENDGLYSADGKTLYLADSSVVTFTVPRTVERLADGLFADFQSLQSVVVDADLETLPTSTFYQCGSLTTVVFNGVVKKVLGFRESENITGNENDVYTDVNNFGAFFNCRSLKSIVFKDGLEYIGDGVFTTFGSALEEISIPASVKEIHPFAFSEANFYLGGLKKITVFGDTTNSRYYSDADSALIERNENGDRLLLFANGSPLTEYVVPASVKELGRNCFFRNANLVKVTLPSDITELPYGCFAVCLSLKEIVLPAALRNASCDSADGATNGFVGGLQLSGKSGVFNNCESLETINLGDTSLEYVHEGMFSYCSKLKSVTLPATVRGVGAYAFEGCPVEAYALSGESGFLSVEEGVLYDKGKTLLIAYPQGREEQAFTVPASVAEIAVGAFADSLLETVEFGDGVAVIGEGAFSFMSALKRLTAGSGVEKIGDGAFFNYYYGGDETDTEDNANDVRFVFGGSAPVFDGTEFFPQNATIKVPTEHFAGWYAKLFPFGHSVLLDKTGVPETTFVLVGADGKREELKALAIDVMPLPDGGASGKYFTGWFFKDGSVDGDWGTEAAFPLVGDGIETTVTVYSRWSDEAREDGSCKEFAFILTDEAKTFTLSNGVYVFRYDYKKTEFGFLSLQCSLEALDFAYIFSVEDATGKTYHPNGIFVNSPTTLYFTVVFSDMEQTCDWEFFISQ